MIVTLLETVTEQVAPVVDVHPDQELKLLFPAVAGAPKDMFVPGASANVKVVVPVANRLVAELP